MLLWPAGQGRRAVAGEAGGEKSARPLGRLHALCTLDGLDALKPDVVQQALSGQASRRPPPCDSPVRLPFGSQHPNWGPPYSNCRTTPIPRCACSWRIRLGSGKDPQAGAALGRLALQDGGDRFLLAAIMSSVNKKNLDSMLLTVLAGGQQTPPPVALAENLLRLANALGDNKTFVTLLRKVATPHPTLSPRRGERVGRGEWSVCPVAIWRTGRPAGYARSTQQISDKAAARGRRSASGGARAGQPFQCRPHSRRGHAHSAGRAVGGRSIVGTRTRPPPGRSGSLARLLIPPDRGGVTSWRGG